MPVNLTRPKPFFLFRLLYQYQYYIAHHPSCDSGKSWSTFWLFVAFYVLFLVSCPALCANHFEYSGISSNLYQTRAPCPCVRSTSAILERLFIGEPRSSPWVIRMSVHRSKNRTHQVIMLIFFQVEIYFALIGCWSPVKWFNRLNSDAAEHPKCTLSALLVDQCFYIIGLGRLVTFDTFHLRFRGVEIAKLSNEGFLIAHLLPYIAVPASSATIDATVLIEPTN